MSKLRIGFVGCGGIAIGKHLPAMRAKKDEVDLVAFCDIIEERAVEMCKQFATVEDAKVYTDYKEMLKDETIDAIHVLTPNNSHCEITVASLESGKHVLCEKPMSATTEEAQKMLDARDKSGKLLTIGYQYRHFPVNALLKKVVSDGLIGDPYYIEASYLRRRGVPTWGVFIDKSKQGGGPNIDIGTHALDLALFCTDNYEVDYVVGTAFEKLGSLPKSEQGQTDGRMQPKPWNEETYDVEDSAFGYIKMKNGAVIILKSSWAINLPDEVSDGGAKLMIAGTKGGVDSLTKTVRLNHIVAGQKATTMIGKSVPNNIVGFSANNLEMESEEANYWVSALKGEGELFVTAEQAFCVTKVLDAIYESSKTGKAIYFND
ncbi:MAG: Gfo/Idh/MocA family oxidoreductase [Clostridia bacterium]